MRTGFNPNKDKPQQASDFWHQLVIPVYIPNQEDYFKDSFEIFKICLESVQKTSHDRTFITVVNNGSHEGVRTFLDQQLAAGKIHELIHSPNIGKLNAIVKGVNGHDFQLVTISDADVLFLDHWQQATYELFNDFPKAGAVAPLSFPSFLKYFTAPVWAKYWSSGRLKFQAVEDVKSLKDFAESINNPNFYKPAQLEKQLVLQSNGNTAGVGSGHFVNTYRGSIFEPPVGKHSGYQLGGGSETKFVDAPVVAKGGYRLSTTKGYARHMGNTLAPWMQNQLGQLEQNQQSFEPLSLKPLKLSAFGRWRQKVLFKIISRGPLWKFILRRKGLSSAQANNY